MKFYEFVDKPPKLPTVIVIEGTERLFAERAVDQLLDRLLPIDVRDLNLERFGPEDLSDVGKLREAVNAMPFLAERRVVLVLDAHVAKAQPRRDLVALAQAVPEGNVLIICDLVGPRSARPKPIASEVGRSALRIDTTAGPDARERFVGELLASLSATAEPRAIDALVRSDTELSAVRNDLSKLALAGKKITLRELEVETVSVEDPKPWKFAGALLEGKTAAALDIAAELFATDPRGAAIPLLSALASEASLVWEMARPGGSLPSRFAWRERMLRPLASRIGERRAQATHERALRGIEAIVTGRAGSEPDDARTLVERIAVECAASLPARRGAT